MFQMGTAYLYHTEHSHNEYLSTNVLSITSKGNSLPLQSNEPGAPIINPSSWKTT